VTVIDQDHVNAKTVLTLLYQIVNRLDVLLTPSSLTMRASVATGRWQ